MAIYQKILQIYRPTNIWDTKNFAKAKIEMCAKLLHGQLQAQLRDGEPILSKYYDAAEGYTFEYILNGEDGSVNPYGDKTKSSKHIWVSGFDSFTVNEWDLVRLKPKNEESVNYDSAAYVRVEDGNEYIYYVLNITPPIVIPKRDEKAIFGVVLDLAEENDLYIEWFDSLIEAEESIKKLNYVDRSTSNDFVSLVNQKDGKIETIHGTLKNGKSILLNDSGYKYLKMDDSSIIPEDYIWSDDNEGAFLPYYVTENNPKYYHVISGINEGYYELRKSIEISLQIDTTNTKKFFRLASESELSDETIQKYSYVGNEYWVDDETQFDVLPEATEESRNYIRVLDDAGWKYYAKTYNGEAYGYEEINYDLGEYLPYDNGIYVQDTFLESTPNGLSVNQSVIENKITDTTGKVLYINGEGFVKSYNGIVSALITGNDITLAGNGSTKGYVDKTIIYQDYNEWQYVDDLQYAKKDHIIRKINNKIVLQYKNGGALYINYPKQGNKDYIEVNGLVYKWNNDGYYLYSINENTSINDAISIVDYLVHNINTGMF